ncbi:hypothetical protein A3B56_01135 [Candidatus Roizmanbacteria bacterium RIFCSPLOWO2_01_FULL_45_11]|uniref:DDH domain-containing protein n=1 Tax=Candidatus Roizmanbacteria bacterium RIFCSPLOWO2_01_FULL_45_11 TaxID=1802070 RepID=A0A1F7JIP2_9BACT|nr:MAG: hypothetical protein A3B56_01135 [Candidatus Roizmanbacteria bacterium RIFCSPLOWO2_01_FULL_45_11]
MNPMGAMNPPAGNTAVFQLRSMLQAAQQILIAFPESTDEDATAAALAMYLILKKIRKSVTVASAGQVKVERAHLVGIDKITSKLAGGNTLVVSMPYAEGSIEKVSYNIDNNRFNLVIEPRGDKLVFNPDDIEYNYGKGDYDLVFTIGTARLEDLGSLYVDHKNAFANKPIINIDNSSQNAGYGRVNIIDSAPISQIMTMVVKSLRLPIDEDIASDLYTGITSAQKSSALDSMSPDSLEAMAFLMRSQAKQLRKQGQETVLSQQPARPVQLQDVPFVRQQPSQQPVTSQAVQQSVPLNQRPQQPVIEEAPEDWLKPKIFHTNKQPN